MHNKTVSNWVRTSMIAIAGFLGVDTVTDVLVDERDDVAQLTSVENRKATATPQVFEQSNNPNASVVSKPQETHSPFSAAFKALTATLMVVAAFTGPDLHQQGQNNVPSQSSVTDSYQSFREKSVDISVLFPSTFGEDTQRWELIRAINEVKEQMSCILDRDIPDPSVKVMNVDFRMEKDSIAASITAMVPVHPSREGVLRQLLHKIGEVCRHRVEEKMRRIALESTQAQIFVGSPPGELAEITRRVVNHQYGEAVTWARRGN